MFLKMLIVIVMSIPALTHAAEPFTYQAFLQQSGVVANGDFDIEIYLHSTDVGGVALDLETYLDTPVTNGVFTVQIPARMVDPFARWIEIRFRGSGAPGGYTTLTPRMHIGASPFASVGLDQQWESFGSFITHGSGTDYVLINRENRIGAEYFGVGADTNSFAGMYVSTTGQNGIPFYGYSAGGDIDAYTQYDGSTGIFSLLIGSLTQIQVSDSGEVEVAGTVEAQDFQYADSIQRYLTISGATFVSSNSNRNTIAYPGVQGISSSDSSSVVDFNAPVNLPDGAVINGLTGYFKDLNNDDPTLELRLYQHELIDLNGFSELALTSSFGLTGAFVAHEVFQNVNAVVVDNSRYAYFLRGTKYFGSSNDGSILGAKIHYLVNNPD